MKAFRITAVLAATIVMGCSSDNPSGLTRDVALSSDVHMVPFKGTVESTDAAPPAGVTCPTPILNGFADTGHATHLGKFTGSHWVCSGFPVPGPGGTFTFAMLSSEAVWVAANGDELWMRLNSTLGGRTVYTFPAGTFVGTVANDIIGGTGRFAGATGVVNISVAGTLGDPSFTADIDGTISSVGSSK